MKIAWLLGAVFLLPGWAAGQNAPAGLPAGTLLAVSLDHGLSAEKLHEGQTVSARLMQSVPHSPIHRGAHVIGRVMEAGGGPGGRIRLKIRFDVLESGGHRIAIRTDLRALASAFDVRAALMPEGGAERGLTPEVWTTQQIGGDQVYRGGGPVTEFGQVVGSPAPYGVLVHPQPNPPCRGAVDSNERLQALWLFSANACGVYGFPHLTIAEAGRSSGVVDLVSSTGELKIGGGAALLLRVTNASR